ncbi:DUF4352 domain-containing protein [Geminocystis sp.]|uniref:DUF4352 domain-containing protein n=1 Tax=Geminocystis sp. TaxID=2664100 RepID=UPI0035947A56
MFSFIGGIIGGIWNFILSIISFILGIFIFLWNFVIGVLGFLWGIVIGLLKLCLAPFLAIWFFFFPAPVTAKTPPQIANQTKIEHQKSAPAKKDDSFIEIFQNPVELEINKWFQENSTVYVKVTVKNHEIPFLQVSSDKFFLTDDKNSTAKSQFFTIKPGVSIISSREVAENGETTGWLVFDMGDQSDYHTLKFNYGLFKDATAKF